MIRHIEPFDNKNKPIVDIDNKTVPLVYFNRLFLNSNESSEYSLENWLQIIQDYNAGEIFLKSIEIRAPSKIPPAWLHPILLIFLLPRE